MAADRIVVVGGGLAGARACDELRRQGYTGRLTLVGAERYAAYDRPPLSKAVLAGKLADADPAGLPEGLPTFDVPDDAEILTGRTATGLRPGVVETDGGPLEFTGLVVATGADPVRLPGPGPQRVLRTVDEARALRDALVPGRRVAVVGAGWIGAEVATAAAEAGCTVTVVEAGDGPLEVALGEVGGFTTEWYKAAGVELRTRTAVASIEDGGLALVGGETLPADEVVVGVGVRPATGWLAGSGLECDRGVVVDERLAAAWDGPPVVAVGDVAAWWSRRFGVRMRVEHWDDALHGPVVAAATLAGVPEAPVHDPVPYFWSDQFGRKIQYAGHRTADARLLVRGDPAAATWAACWLTPDGALTAIAAVGRPRDVVQGRRRIAAGDHPDPDRLADPSILMKDV